MSSVLSGILRFVYSLFCASPPRNEGFQPPEVIITAPSPQAEHPPHDHENYDRLRAQARQEGDAMAKCFEESRVAYQSGDGARAKLLSNEGHEHQRRMNEYNSKASEFIFQVNNRHSSPQEVDLHGLFVAEAVSYTEKAVQAAQARGDPQIRLIVGKGLHSTNHVAKVKPAIEGLMQRHNLSAHLDEKNSGVLIVTLNGDTAPREQQLGPDDIIHRIENDDKGCVIM